MNRSTFLVFVIAFLFCTCLAAPSDKKKKGLRDKVAAPPKDRPARKKREDSTPDDTEEKKVPSDRRGVPAGRSETGITPEGFKNIYKSNITGLHKTYLKNYEQILRRWKEGYPTLHRRHETIKTALAELRGQKSVNAIYSPIRKIKEDMGAEYHYVLEMGRLLGAVFSRKNEQEFSDYSDLFYVLNLARKSGRPQEGNLYNMLNAREGPLTNLENSKLGQYFGGSLVIGRSSVWSFKGYWVVYNIDNRHAYRMYYESLKTILMDLPPKERKRRPEFRIIMAALKQMHLEGLPARCLIYTPFNKKVEAGPDAQIEYLERLLLFLSSKPKSVPRTKEKKYLTGLVNLLKRVFSATIEANRVARRAKYLARPPVTNIEQFMTKGDFEFLYKEGGFNVYLMFAKNLEAILSDSNKKGELYKSVKRRIESMESTTTPQAGTVAPITAIKPGVKQEQIEYVENLQEFLVNAGPEHPLRRHQFAFLTGLLNGLRESVDETE